MSRLKIILLFLLSATPLQLAMADTTTPNLGLTLPTIGSNNWGGKMNQNLQILDGFLPTNNVKWIRDDFKSQVNGIRTSFFLSTTTATQPIFVILDGLVQSTADFTIQGSSQVVMSTAPAANTNSFFAMYTLSISSPASISGAINQVAKFVTSNGVGNSQITDNGTNVGIGTTTIPSKLTVQDGDVQISTTTGSRGIIFQDGSKQATAAIFVGTTTLFNVSYSVSRLALGPVDPQISTLTYTAAGGRVWLDFECECGAQNATNMVIGALVDGQFFDGETTTKGFIDVNAGTPQGVNFSCSWKHLTTGNFSGPHSWSITAARPLGGSQTIGSTDQICQFGAYDAH